MKRRYQKGFGVGFTRGLVKRMLKRNFGFKGILKRKPKWFKQMLKDCNYFDLQLCETLLIANPEEKSFFIDLVNAHLELEAIIQDVHVEPKVYSLGEASKIFGYESKIVRESSVVHLEE